MSGWRGSSGAAAILAALLAVVVWAESACAQAVVHVPPEDARSAVQHVLSAREFNRGEVTESSWLRWLWEKLRAGLGHLRDWLHSLPGWVFYLIVLWLVLTLLAILGHLLYVVITQFGRGSRTRRAGGSNAGADVFGIADLDFAGALAGAEDRRRAGDWAGAIRWYYVAALLWLDGRNLVRYARSKTNRDYVREIPQRGALRDDFERLTLAFEAVAYGERAGNQATCETVASTVEALRREADDGKPA